MHVNTHAVYCYFSIIDHGCEKEVCSIVQREPDHNFLQKTFKDENAKYSALCSIFRLCLVTRLNGHLFWKKSLCNSRVEEWNSCVDCTERSRTSKKIAHRFILCS